MGIFSKTLKYFFYFFVIGGGLIFFIFIFLFFQIPSEAKIRGCLTTKLYEVDLCSTSSRYISFGKISPYLIRAVVMTEDSTFWTHRGFDFVEIQRSLEKNIDKGVMARGGSTITQQLAKNLFLTSEKTFSRKIAEAFITLRIEKTLTKKEILEKYLNVVQFGKNLFGVKDAAAFYFQKVPLDLNVIEASFLAFLLPSPEKYSKSFFVKKLTPFARNRLEQIITGMYKTQRIDEIEYDLALKKLVYFPQYGPVEAPSEETIEIIEEDIINPD